MSLNDLRLWYKIVIFHSVYSVSVTPSTMVCSWYGLFRAQTAETSPANACCQSGGGVLYETDGGVWSGGADSCRTTEEPSTFWKEKDLEHHVFL